ncbi:MAG: hypothetical protein M1820_005388 [Bogoriella megaspora]|nr:MAG: hypothetical protein M1820_005388 [Bogoriella megaspora]
MVSSNNPSDESTKAKLRCNLWLALNDVRLLLEPSEANIQALILLACHVEEFTTPSTCWMLLLEGCARAEKPFLNKISAASIDLGLCMVNWEHQYLLVLLTRSSARNKPQCIESSKRMLHMLEDMVSDSEEPYNGIIWQLLCCPFTPFLVLFGEILSNGKMDLDEKREEESKEALAAMEKFAVFLGKMSLRNSLAAKLERIAVVFIQHAKSMIHSQESRSGRVAPDSSTLIEALPDLWPTDGDMLRWDSLLDPAMTAGTSEGPQIDTHDAQQWDPALWTSNFLGDTVIDWINSQV